MHDDSVELAFQRRRPRHATIEPSVSTPTLVWVQIMVTTAHAMAHAMRADHIPEEVFV
jgi:hypothetical protein